MPIGLLCIGKEERNGLQREGWNARCIPRPHLGCSRWHKKSAEAAKSNSRCSQPSGNVRCCRWWRFRRITSSTVQLHEVELNIKHCLFIILFHTISLNLPSILSSKRWHLRNRSKSDMCLYELLWIQRPRKSSLAKSSISREAPCIPWSKYVAKIQENFIVFIVYRYNVFIRLQSNLSVCVMFISPTVTQ